MENLANQPYHLKSSCGPSVEAKERFSKLMGDYRRAVVKAAFEEEAKFELWCGKYGKFGDEEKSLRIKRATEFAKPHFAVLLGIVVSCFANEDVDGIVRVMTSKRFYNEILRDLPTDNIEEHGSVVDVWKDRDFEISYRSIPIRNANEYLVGWKKQVYLIVDSVGN